jgi:signal transduction histidine kinase
MEALANSGVSDFARFIALGVAVVAGNPVSFQGRQLGCIMALTAGRMHESTPELVKSLAALVAPHLQMRITEVESRQETRRAAALERIARSVIERETFSELCGDVMEFAREVVGFDGIVVRTRSGPGDVCQVAYSGGTIDPAALPPGPAALAGTVVPRVAAKRTPVLVDGGSPEYGSDPEIRALLEEFPSIVVAPLIEGESFLGTLEFYSLNEYAYDDADLRRVNHVAALFTSAAAQFKLLGDLTREVEIRTVLADVARTAATGGELEASIIGICQNLMSLVAFDRAVFVLPDTWVGFSLSGSDEAARTELPAHIELARGATSQPCPGARSAGGGVPSGCAKAPLWPGSDGRGESWLHIHRENGTFTTDEAGLLAEVARHVAPAMDSVLTHRAELQIAEERQRTRAAEAEAAHLQRINEAKREFMSTISHELRTPLTPIRTFVDILRKNGEENMTPRQKEHISVIRRNVEWLKILIDDMLEVSRVEAGRVDLRPEDTDLCELARDMARSFEPLLESTGHDLKLVLPHTPVMVYADGGRLSQVLGNLLTNAVKYSPRGSAVRVIVRRVSDGVRLYIRDEGAGIPAGQRSRLFQMFERADTPASRAAPGTGIGLYVSKRLIEAHGGTISLHSVEGKYTTVTFWLPSGAAQLEPEAERLVA